MPWRRAWQPTPVFLPRYPMNGGIWWAAIQDSKESDTTERLPYTHADKGQHVRWTPACGHSVLCWMHCADILVPSRKSKYFDSTQVTGMTHLLTWVTSIPGRIKTMWTEHTSRCGPTQTDYLDQTIQEWANSVHTQGWVHHLQWMGYTHWTASARIMTSNQNIHEDETTDGWGVFT